MSCCCCCCCCCKENNGFIQPSEKQPYHRARYSPSQRGRGLLASALEEAGRVGAVRGHRTCWEAALAQAEEACRTGAEVVREEVPLLVVLAEAAGRLAGSQQVQSAGPFADGGRRREESIRQDEQTGMS
jgi:hypothetical protein